MKKLQILPLGGMGEVTQNMFLYIYDQEILIVDCGIGFPDQYMPGADIIIPDIAPLQAMLNEQKKIVGMILSHGHDDHIAALAYLLPDLPNFPIYASPLTAGFATQRVEDGGVKKKISVMQDGKKVNLGEHFSFTSLPITHSVPDTKHLLINTPEGVIYHGTDFKLDPEPVDGVLSDLETAKKAGEAGVKLMLMDCLRVERSDWSKSESSVGPAIEREITNVRGKFIVTLMSSHIHRIQQVVDIAVKHRRKVAFIGRSVEQNVKVALNLGKLHIPEGVKISKKRLNQYPDHELVIIIAGSQGQEGSSMVRAVYGEHRAVQIKQTDKVVFSADAIPGNEVPYYKAIDELSRNKIEVVYPDLSPHIHHTGHASAEEQTELLSIVKPEYVMPIGGADRHRELFRKNVAHKLGYTDKQILLPDDGEILSLDEKGWNTNQRVSLHPKIVDGLGVGDVGPTVLSDRMALSEAGIVVVVVPRRNGVFDKENINIISRGFVFMRQADEVIGFIKEATVEIIEKAEQGINDYQLKKDIEKGLSKKLYKVIEREPMIVSVILEQK